MYNYKLIISTLLALMKSGCAMSLESQVAIRSIDKKIFYQGPITLEGVNRLLLEMNKNTSNQLYIDSQGGSSEAGMLAGEYISKNNVSVIVIGNCHSSCANYIFLPSKNKIKIQTAEIGLHGGAQSYEIARRNLYKTMPFWIKPIYRASIDGEAIKTALEKKLLSGAGVNENIIKHSADMTIYGRVEFNLNILGKNFLYYIPEKKMTGYDLWFPNFDKYEQWGIKMKIISDKNIPADFIKFVNFDASQNKLKILIK